MKKNISFRSITAVLLIICLALAFVGCGKKDTYDYRANLAGTYEAYHWFINEANGDSGFYDEPLVYTFGTDGSFAAEGGNLKEALAGTYTFTGDNTINVTYDDGSFDNYTLRYSADHGTIELTNDATAYADSMERAS